MLSCAMGRRRKIVAGSRRKAKSKAYRLTLVRWRQWCSRSCDLSSVEPWCWCVSQMGANCNERFVANTYSINHDQGPRSLRTPCHDNHIPPMRAWLEQPHGRRHKAPPQPCALTTTTNANCKLLGDHEGDSLSCYQLASQPTGCDHQCYNGNWEGGMKEGRKERRKEEDTKKG